MMKLLIHVPILAILIMAGFAPARLRAAADSRGIQEPTAESVVFELRYRALTAPDDVLSYRSFWGFGASPPTDVPFLNAVKKQVQRFDPVYNFALTNRQWSVVELKSGKPVALYFDLDADGKLSNNERILPTASSKPRPEHEFAFITPDFTIRQEDGREIPFRVLLVANSYGDDRMNYMWSPCGILEGQATLAGQATRLLLYGDGFSGSFDTFGRCSFALVPAEQRLEGYLSRATLSSLICHDGAFYRLTLDGAHEKDKTPRVTLRTDTSPRGRIAVTLKGAESLQSRLPQATIAGDEDASISFDLLNMSPVIPVGRYRLSRGHVSYGVGTDPQWRVDFSEGPRFAIDADKTTEVELGTLTLSVSAINERERYDSDVKEKSAYARGTPIYLTPRIKGQAGEVYLRFSRQNAGGNQWTDVRPHVTILNARGKKVASADMEYG